MAINNNIKKNLNKIADNQKRKKKGNGGSFNTAASSNQQKKPNVKKENVSTNTGKPIEKNKQYKAKGTYVSPMTGKRGKGDPDAFRYKGQLKQGTTKSGKENAYTRDNKSLITTKGVIKQGETKSGKENAPVSKAPSRKSHTNTNPEVKWNTSPITGREKAKAGVHDKKIDKMIGNSNLVVNGVNPIELARLRTDLGYNKSPKVFMSEADKTNLPADTYNWLEKEKGLMGQGKVNEKLLHAAAELARMENDKNYTAGGLQFKPYSGGKYGDQELKPNETNLNTNKWFGKYKYMDDFEEGAKKGDEMSKKTGGIYDMMTQKYVVNNTGATLDTGEKTMAVGYMNKNELQTYNYILANEGIDRAREYLKYLEPTLNTRKGLADAQAQKEKEGVAKYLGATAMAVEGGLSRSISGFKQAPGMFRADYTPIAKSYEEIASEAYRKDITNPWGKVIYDLIENTSNMAPTIALSTLMPVGGGLVGSTAMGLSAAGNTYTAELIAGRNPRDARRYALIIGALEGGLQYALGGIDRLGGLVKNKVFKDRLAAIGNGTSRALLEYSGDMLSEGFEEGLQEVLAPIVASMVYDEEYTPAEIQDVMYSALIGALSSGVIQAPSLAAGLYNAKNAPAQEPVAQEEPEQTGEEALAQTAAEMVREQAIANNGGNANIDYNDVYMNGAAEEPEATLMSEEPSAKRDQRLEEIGVFENQEDYDNGVYSAEPEEDTVSLMGEEAPKAMSSDDAIAALSQGLDTAKANKNMSADAAVAALSKSLSEPKATPVNAAPQQAKVSAQTTTAPAKGFQAVSRARQAVRDFGKTLGKVGERVIDQIYNEDVDHTTFIAEATRAYNQGYYGNDSARSAKPYTVLDSNYRDMMFRAGQADANAAVEKGMSDRGRAIVQKEAGLYTNENTAKVFSEKETRAVHSVLKSLGLKGIIVDAVDSEDAGFQGFIEKGTVIISSVTKDPTKAVIGHEITHRMQELAPEEYKIAKDFIRGLDEEAFDKEVEDTIALYKEHGVELSYEEAGDEYVADYFGMIISDKELLESFAEVSEPSVLKKFINALKNIWNRIVDKEIRDDVHEAIKLLENVYKASVAEAANAEKVDVLHEDMTEGTLYNDKGRKYSYASMSQDYDEGIMFEDLKGVISDKEIRELKKGIKRILDFVGKTPQTLAALDMNENMSKQERIFFPYKPNSDPLYKVSLDFSTMCTKRLVMQSVISRLQIMEGKAMSDERQIKVKKALQKYQEYDDMLLLACHMCYVEAARLKASKPTNEWLKNPEPIITKYFAKLDKEYKQLVEEYKKELKQKLGYEPDTPAKAMSSKDKEKFDKKVSNMRKNYKLKPAEYKYVDIAKGLDKSYFLSPEGLTKLKVEQPLIYDAFISAVRSATRSKTVETQSPYYYGDSTFEKKTDDAPEKGISDKRIEQMNAENGLRFSSWSDWQIKMALDMMSAVIDLSVRGAKMHGYTKFPAFVRIFGKTGMMFNLSGVLQTTDVILNEDGTYSIDNFDNVEGIDIKEAIKVRDEFPETAGVQVIGVSDEQILAMLKTDWIDYIIPYHSSGLSKKLRTLAGIEKWTDYTKSQEARAIEDMSEKKKEAKALGKEKLKEYYVEFCKQEHPKWKQETIDEKFTIDEGVKAYIKLLKWHEKPDFSEWMIWEKKHPDGTAYTAQELMKKSSENYIELCEKRGLVPAFQSIYEKDPDNYWKLLVDRKMINQETGELIIQQPVKPYFDYDTLEAEMQKELDNYEILSSQADAALVWVGEHAAEFGLALSNDIKEEIDNVKHTITSAATLDMLNGKRRNSIKRADTNSKEFKQWFGDSKVVNEDGSPKVVYHGTPFGDIHEFGGAARSEEAKWYTRNDPRKKDKGVYWFIDNEETADLFASQEGYSEYGDYYVGYYEPNKIKTFLRIEKPYILDCKGATWHTIKLPEELKKDFKPMTVMDSEEVYDYYIKKNGEKSKRKKHYTRWKHVTVERETSHTDEIAQWAKDNGYDGIIFKNLREGGDFNPNLGTAYAVFNPTQIKSATDNVGTFDRNNPDIRFSIKRSPEQAKNLVALHNITEAKLLKALKLGGFPMPSIAVTLDNVIHSNFGSITLLFGRNTIDPKADRRNVGFSADVWSPTFPRTEYEANPKVQNRFYKMYSDLSNRYGDDAAKPLQRFAYELGNKLDENEGLDGLIESLKNDNRMKKTFLYDKGYDVPKPVINRTETKIDDDLSPELIDILGSKLDEVLPLAKYSMKEERDQWIADNRELILGAVAEANERLGKEESLEDKPDGWVWARARTAAKYRQDGGVTVTESEDYAATQKAISDAVNQEEYEQWLNDLLQDAVLSEGVWNGKSMYTPAGNRRSFKQLHYPVTLENIVKAMSNQDIKNVAGFQGVKTLRGAAAVKFKSVDEMHKYEHRLQNRTPEEAQELVDSLNDRLNAITTTIRGNSDDYYNGVGNTIEEIAESKDFSVENIYNTFTDYYRKNITEDVAEELSQLLYDISEMPTNLYEIKPKRVVGIDEILEAIIPEDASQEIIDALNEAGIQWSYYDGNSDASRNVAVNRAADKHDARFSISRNQSNDSDSRLDAEYMAAVEEAQRTGVWDKVKKMVNDRAKELRAEVFAMTDTPAYRVRRGARPKRTIKVYKVFTLSDDGKPSALFVSSNNEIPIGVWLDAIDTFHVTDQKSGLMYVPSTPNQWSDGGATGTSIKLSNLSEEDIQGLIDRGYLDGSKKLPKNITMLAYRPGWHAGDLPYFPQGGMRGNQMVTEKGLTNSLYDPEKAGSNYQNIHRYNQVVFECEMIVDNDYTSTDEKGALQDMQTMPVDGSYKYSTNPMTKAEDLGTWYIGSSIKIVRALSQEECDRILAENNRLPQEWEQRDAEGNLVTTDKIRDITDTEREQLALGKIARDKKKRDQLDEKGIPYYRAADKTWRYDAGMAAPLRWVSGVLDLDKLGYDPNQNDGGKKLLDPVTYDDDGNIIPLSKRFNANVSDPRYSISRGNRIKTAEETLKEGKKKAEKELKEAEKTVKKLNAKNEALAIEIEKLKSENKISRRSKTKKQIDINLVDKAGKKWLEQFNNKVKYADIRGRVLEVAREVSKAIFTENVADALEDAMMVASPLAFDMAMETLHKTGNKSYINPFDVEVYELADEMARELILLMTSDPNLYNKRTAEDIRKDEADENRRTVSGLKDSLKKATDSNISKDEKIKELREDIKDAKTKLAKAKTAHETATGKLKTEYGKEINKLNSKIAELSATLEVEKVSNAMQSKAMKKMLDIVKRERDKAQQKADHLKETADKKREKAKVKEQRDRLERKVKKLSSLLRNPTDDKHVPEQLRAVTAQVLSLINMSSSEMRDAKGVTKKTIAFQELRNYYIENYTNVVIDDSVFDAGGLIDQVEKLADKSYMDMTEEELISCIELVDAMSAAIKNYNKLFATERWSGVHEISNQLREDNGGRKAKDKLIGVFGTLQKITGIEMLEPLTYFHMLGEAGDAIFRSLRNAQDAFTMIVKEASDFSMEVSKGIKPKKLEKKIVKVTLGGKEVKMPMTHLMNLYCLSKRPSGLHHIINGGIKQAKRTKRLKVINDPVAISNITVEELNAAFAKIPAPAIAVADALQKFVSVTMSDKQNEASLSVFGIKKFNEDIYWRIKVYNAYIPNNAEKLNVDVTTIRGMGHAKALKENAAQPIVIESIFDAFSGMVVDGAKYAAYLKATVDVDRIRNYKFDPETESEYSNIGTMKVLLDNVFGAEEGTDYLTKLLTDISTGIAGIDSEANFSDKLVSNFKGAAIGANLRVVIQQPTSLLRAFEAIGAGYFATEIPVIDYIRGWKRAVKHSPIAQWKDWGYFDVQTGRQIKDILFRTESNVNKIKELSMVLVGAADAVSWGCIWMACENKVKHTRKDLKTNTDEYYAAVNEIFTDVIDRTQVVDGVLQRTQIMRNSNPLVKQTTSFMAEPMKQWNMMIRALSDVKQKRKGAKRHLMTTVFVLGSSVTLNAAAQSVMDAVRDDDREEKWLEKWIRKMFGWNKNDSADMSTYDKIKAFALSNLGGAYNVGNYIPYVKDMFSLLQGYELKRMDFDNISKFIKSGTYLLKALKGEGETTVQSALVDFISYGAQVTGMPLYNLRREILTWAEFVANQTDDYELQYVLTAYKNVLGADTTSSKYYDLLWKTLDMNSGSYDKVRAAILNTLIADGMTEAEANKKIVDQLSKRLGSSTTLDMMLTSSLSDFEAIRADAVDKLVKAGMSESDANKTVVKGLAQRMKNAGLFSQLHDTTDQASYEAIYNDALDRVLAAGYQLSDSAMSKLKEQGATASEIEAARRGAADAWLNNQVKGKDKTFMAPAAKSAYEQYTTALKSSSVYTNLDASKQAKVDDLAKQLAEGKGDQYAKLKAATDAGVSGTNLLLFEAALKASDKNGDGQYSQMEFLDAKNMGAISASDARLLWTAWQVSWSKTKNQQAFTMEEVEASKKYADWRAGK